MQASVPAARPALATTSDIEAVGVREISGALTLLLADFFSLYVKTKNFHWHMAGRDFRDFHRALDDQSDQLIAATDPLAERARKLGGMTIRSVGQIGRLSRLLDNDADFVTAPDMLAELRDDNLQLVRAMREAHDLCDNFRDFATASLIETLIDEAETRHWFLFEMTRTRPSEIA